MEEEIWKDVPGYEGLYQASNLGRIKKLGDGLKRKDKIFALNPDGYEYQYTTLIKNGKTRSFGNHVIVAMAFLNYVPKDRSIVVDHKNFTKRDNRLSNLQIISFNENINRRRPSNIIYNYQIAPTLNKMEVNETAKFDLERYSVIASAIQRVQMKNIKKGFRFEMRKSGDEVEVTRTD